MNDATKLADLLKTAVRGFTQFHDDMKVKIAQPTRHSLFLSFQAHRDDMGKLIGEGGCMVKAMRQVAQAMGDSIQTRVRLNIVEPVKGEKQPTPPPKKNPAYRIEPEVALLQGIGEMIFNDGVTVKSLDVDDESSVLVLIADEQHDDALAFHLNTIFTAIGRTQGRKLSVEVDMP